MGKAVLSNKQISKIVTLRQRGHSLPEIRRLTHHSNGTVFKYIKGIKILPEFEGYWKNRRKPSVWRKAEQQKKAGEQAREIVKDINKREKILIAASLYWAEGAKRDFNLSNSDPELIKTFIECLKELGIGKDNISINVRIFSDLDKEKACEFWSRVIGISRKQIAYVDVLSGKKEGKLPHGLCRVRVVKGGYFLKLLKEIRNCIVKKVI